jgi:hypothetical protein
MNKIIKTFKLILVQSKIRQLAQKERLKTSSTMLQLALSALISEWLANLILKVVMTLIFLDPGKIIITE